MPGDALDILRPDDPFDLIQGNWPPQSEESYRAAEHAAAGASLSAVQSMTQTVTIEEDVQDEMSGKTADRLVDAFDRDAHSLRQAACDYSTAAGWMLTAGEAVADAKRSIVQHVLAGNEAISTAESEEAAGGKPDPSSNELITKYRDRIATEKTDLDTTLSGIGHALAGDPDAPTAPGYVAVPTHPTPAQPGPSPTTQQQMLASDTGNKEPGQPLPPQQHLPPIQQPGQPGAQPPGRHGAPNMPGLPGSPSAGSPGTGGPSGTGGLGGQAGLGSPSGLGNPSSDPGVLNPLGIGNPSSNSAGTSTGTAPDSGAGAATPLGDASLAAAAGGLSGFTGLGPALSGLPATGIAGAPGGAAAAGSSQLASPAYPAGTGSTPGVAAPLGPFTPGTAGTPVTPNTPGVPSGTPGSPAGPGAPTSPVAAPGSAASAPKIDGTAMGRDHWAAVNTTQRGTTATPLLGVVGGEEEKRSAPTTYVSGFSDAEVIAHTVLASIRFHVAQKDGWLQPIAVAVTVDTAGRTETLFATADGLSIIPAGVCIPAGVTPLSDHPNRPGAGWLGYADPARKLSMLPGVVTIVSTEETEFATTQTVQQAQELLLAGAAPTGSVARGDWADKTLAAIRVAQAVAALPAVPDPRTAGDTLRELRWAGDQPTGYVAALVEWLVAEAAEAFEVDSLSEASWLAGQALTLLGDQPIGGAT